MDSVYRRHPVRAETILRRLEQQGVSAPIGEWDLAIDSETELTDQNHSGGYQAVLDLARLARVSRLSKVLDVGAGIGGVARLLAQAFGASTIAVERNAQRLQDCQRLTDLVGLSRLVTCELCDATATTTKDSGPFDVLWGHSAWAHFERAENFLDMWLPLLSRQGRVVIADSYRREGIATSSIRRLERLWHTHLTCHTTWVEWLTARGLTIVHVSEHSLEAAAHFARLSQVSATWPEGTATELEREMWQVAREAFESGLVRNVRTVARF